MADFTLLFSFLTALIGVSFFFYYAKRKNSPVDNDGCSATTTAFVDGVSKDGESDVIIVGAGVAGAALAHTLGKVLFNRDLLSFFFFKKVLMFDLKVMCTFDVIVELRLVL